MNKNKKRFTSALLLLGTSVASACMQNASKCAADGESWIWTYFLLPLKSLFSSIFSCFTSDNEENLEQVKRVNGDRYFKAVLGESEEAFREKLKKGEGFTVDDDGNIVMINSKNKHEYCAGKIEFKSLGDLRKEAKNINGKGKGKISILGINKSRRKASEKLLDKIDVSCLQGDKKNKGAVFLVASNWNIVELLSSWDFVEEKKITESGQPSYFVDSTQAPPARLANLAGTVACHDLVNMERYPDDPLKWSQTSEGDQQVNLLEGLGIRTVNGYIVDDIENIKRVVEGLEKGDIDLENKFKICYHGGQQVCAKKVSVGSSAKERFADVIYDPDQKIDQIYSAAVSLGDHDVQTIAALNVCGWQGYDKLEGNAKEKEHIRRCDAFEKMGREKNSTEYKRRLDETKNILTRLAKQIARLNYEAIIKSAIAKGKKKLYLTLLGCGVFENKSEWVIDAINNCKKLIENSGLEVIINISASGLRDEALYEKLALLIYDSEGKKVGNFDILDEKDGNVVNVGENILNKVKPKIVVGNSENADKSVFLSDSEFK